MLFQWYGRMQESVEQSRRQEAIVDQFRSISEQNMQASVFKALVERVSE